MDSVSEEPPEQPRITVVQALPKGDRGELAVETMTEVGVDAVVPWAAARCITQWKGDRGLKALGKWRATAREAGKQSRRVRFPEVAEAATTKQVAALLAGADFAAVLHESGDEPLATAELPSSGEIVLVVGPEGGVAPEELALFEEAGAKAYRLGRSVLRTSTAGTAAPPCSWPAPAAGPDPDPSRRHRGTRPGTAARHATSPPATASTARSSASSRSRARRTGRTRSSAPPSARRGSPCRTAR